MLFLNLTFRCVLGEKRTYTKLKKESICYNGRSHEHQQNSAPCKCGKKDFKCDFGYKRTDGKFLAKISIYKNLPKISAGECIPDDDQRNKDHICINGKKDEIVTKVGQNFKRKIHKISQK